LRRDSRAACASTHGKRVDDDQDDDDIARTRERRGRENMPLTLTLGSVYLILFSWANPNPSIGLLVTRRWSRRCRIDSHLQQRPLAFMSSYGHVYSTSLSSSLQSPSDVQGMLLTRLDSTPTTSTKSTTLSKRAARRTLSVLSGLPMEVTI
jgi:hypothetical protein